MSITYGTVFLLDRDASDEHVDKHFAKMTELGLNTIVIWPPLFYENGEMYFDKHLKAMNIAGKHGLELVIELTGQVPNLEFWPDCMYDEDVMVQDHDGSVVHGQNGLGELNFNHPRVQQRLREFIHACANTYKNHHVLKAWDVWNETHFKSFDPYTMKKFHSWLEKKYCSIGELNRVWSKSYTNFDQIYVDPVLWASIAPQVDWEAFRCDNLAAIVKFLCDCVHEVDDAHPCIVDNVMSNAGWHEVDRGTDDWLVAQNTDLYGISFYPKTGGRLLKDNSPWLRSLNLAGARSAGGGSFMISEFQSHTYSEIGVSERVSPSELLHWNFEALSHGANGIVYWKWAPFRWGMQIGGRGLVSADGRETPRADAAQRVAALLRDKPELCAGKPVDDQVGILFDQNVVRVLGATNNRIADLVGTDQLHRGVFGAYRALHRQNIHPRILTPEQLTAATDLKTLILPYQIAIDSTTSEALTEFVRNGGTVMVSFPFASFNDNCMLQEELPGGPLQELLGVRHEDNLAVDSITWKDGKTFSLDCSLDIQRVSIQAADRVETVATAEGVPLLLSIACGKGRIFCGAAALWNHIYDIDNEALAGAILSELGTQQRYTTRREICVNETKLDSGERVLFICNYGDSNEIIIKQPTAAQAELVWGDGELLVDGAKLTIRGTEPVYILKVPAGGQA